MVGGTVAAGALLERVAVNPPAGAGFDIPTIAVLGFPPVTVPGNMPTLDSIAGGGGAWTVMDTWLEELLKEAVIVTGVSAVTAVVFAVEVRLCAPVGRVTVAGTLSTAGLLLVSDTTAPLPCAPVVSVAVTCTEDPPATKPAAAVSDSSVGGGGGGGGVPFNANFVMKASAANPGGVALNTPPNTFGVTGKSEDWVTPVTKTLPVESSVTSVA